MLVESLFAQHAEHIFALCLIWMRLIGFFVLVPSFGAGTLPVRIRILFAVAVSIVILPACEAQVVRQPTLAMYGVSIVQEVILGLALGTGVQLFFGGLDVAGKLMGEISGLSVIRSYDETAQSTDALRAFLRGFAGCLFFVFGGHRLLMQGVMDSLKSLPPGEAHFNSEVTHLLVSILTQSFQFGLRVAAPAVLAMVVASLAVGFASRSVPQLSSLTLGMGMNVLLLLAVLLISLGAVGWVFQDFVEHVAAEMFTVLS